MIWRVSICLSSQAPAGCRRENVRRFEVDTGQIVQLLERFPPEAVVYIFLEPSNGVLSQWRASCIRKPVRYRERKQP
jgi:hypothetical protein